MPRSVPASASEPLPHAASCNATPPAANSTETNAASAVANCDRMPRLTNNARNIPPMPVPMTAMFRIFAPSMPIPPSPKRNACTSSTSVIESTAAGTPITAAARTPASKCPEMPCQTGKLIIWRPKTAAVTTANKPAGGTFFLFFKSATPAAPTPVAAITAVTGQTAPFNISDGMCIYSILLFVC